MESPEALGELSHYLLPDLAKIALSYLQFDPRWWKVDKWETPSFISNDWRCRFSNPIGITKVSDTQAVVLEREYFTFVCLQTGEIQKKVDKVLEVQTPGKIVSFPANRRIVATKDYTGFRVYDTQGTMLHSVPDHFAPLSWMRGSDIAKLNKKLLVVATQRRVGIYDLHRKEFIDEWDYNSGREGEEKRYSFRVKVAKVGPWKVAVVSDCVRILDLREKAILAQWGKFDETPDGVIKISGNRIAIMTLDSSIQIFDIQSGQLLSQLKCQERPGYIGGRRYYADSCRGIDRIGKYGMAVSDRMSVTFYTEFLE